MSQAILVTVLGSTVTLFACCRDSQRHTSQAHRNPPAKLLYQSWRCYAGDNTVSRVRYGKSITFFLCRHAALDGSPGIILFFCG
jgi:hypothetical protein